MKYYMIFFTLFVFLLLSHLTLRQLIKLYFRTQTKRFNQKSNFITKYSILIAFAGYCVINPNITDTILNYAIDLCNNHLDLKIESIHSELGPLSIFTYSILCFFLGYSLYITYNNSNRESIKERFLKRDIKNDDKKNIQFPSNDFKESPILRIRLKKYFELKFQKNDLKLENSIKDKILYGKYKDGFRTYYIFIIYDEDLQKSSEINKNQIENRFEKLNEFVFNIISRRDIDNYLIDYYYITNDGVFDKYTRDNYYTKTENDILNELIDFNSYLKKIINDYNNEKIFSAIALEKDKKTLAETFISPLYSINEKEIESTNLVNHINNWINNSSDSKHLVLLGDYGMGKTSFLKHYSQGLAQEILSGNDISRYPVMISLTNSSPRHGGIEEKIKAFVADNLGIDYSLFEILIYKGKILFLLDGFDEMGFVGTHEDRFKQINEIWQLASNNNKLLISGRPSYFPTKEELIKTFNVVNEDEQILQTNPYCESIYLNLLTENQILEYIRKYYPKKALDFFNWITQYPSILELCKRPSMMHIIREMLPNLHKQQSIKINSHGGVIEKYVDYWINRQQSKNIQSAFDNHIKKREFVKSFFCDLAVDLFLNKQYVLSSDYVLQKLEKNISEADIKQFKTNYQKEGFENEMLTCYFIEIDDGYYRFVHKSFFEFFVAQKIIENISTNKFNSDLILEEWSNSIVNFVYDEIPKKLKNNKSIPALLLLTNRKWISSTKTGMYKFFVRHEDSVLGFYTITFLLLSLSLYIQLVKFETVWKIILAIPYLIINIFILVIIFISIKEALKSNKKIQYITKSFKISFIKNQFEIANNLDLVIPLLGIETLPHIPIENIQFEKKNFTKCNFYSLKNVKFQSCTFATPILENCNLNSVTFKETSFTSIIFNNCRFNRVNFIECSFESKEQQQSSRIFNKRDVGSVVHFENCEFDDDTINNLKKLIENKIIAKEKISGCKKFKKLI